ncbi:hypothetical protein ACQW5G_04735 [Fructilactobacillus sp. Tb1]|uniref:hypothetical protein n=1 Tax=Fructilactobacillus sp. Tb1 TaxID=3422304 RepID=UPI003D2710D3
MKIRYSIEILVTILLVVCGIYSLLPSHQHVTEYKIDHGQMSYNGNLLNHKFDKEGKLTYADHDSYKGDFKDGQFNGKGTFTSKDHWTYTGTFKDGVPDGHGKLVINGKTYQGNFKKGQLVNAH